MRIKLELDNIFTSVTRYKKPENQFTASLVYLLRHLWRESKDNEVLWDKYCNFLNELCGDRQIKWSRQLIIDIQKSEKRDEDDEEGIVDFEISCPKSVLVGVEVKDTAPVASGQLKQYHNSLKDRAKREGYRHSKVVLLRNNYISEELTKDADHDFRWCQLYVLLKDMLRHHIYEEHTSSDYLLKEFLKYLEQKGVPPVDRISTDHLKGFPSLLSLLWLVEKEAKGTFEKARLGLTLSATNFEHYSDETEEFDYISFDFRHKRSNAYNVEVYGPDYNDPERNTFSIGFKTNSEWLVKSEGMQLELPSDDKDFNIDNEGFVYIQMPLNSVFDKETLGEQSDRIGELLQEMYDKLNTKKRPIRARARRTNKI